MLSPQEFKKIRVEAYLRGVLVGAIIATIGVLITLTILHIK